MTSGMWGSPAQGSKCELRCNSHLGNCPWNKTIEGSVVCLAIWEV